MHAVCLSDGHCRMDKIFLSFSYFSYLFSYFKHIYTGYKFNKDIVLQFGPVKIKPILVGGGKFAPPSRFF